MSQQASSKDLGQRTVADHIAVLQTSARGRLVGAQLLRLVDGEWAGLEQHGKAAVLGLLVESALGLSGTVLWSLDEAFGAMEVR